MIHPPTSRMPKHDWFLLQWCEYHEVDQAELRRRTGWSKRKASEIWTGEQRFNRDSLNEAAWALNAQPFELLLMPDVAHDYRAMRAAIEHSAARLAADNRQDFGSFPDEGGEERRKASNGD